MSIFLLFEFHFPDLKHLSRVRLQYIVFYLKSKEMHFRVKLNGIRNCSLLIFRIFALFTGHDFVARLRR